MSKAILCTIDFSESSRQTVGCAALLARDLNAHLTVLYTYRLIRAVNEEVFGRKKTIELNAQASFASLETEILKSSGIAYDFKTEVGFLSDRIEAYARESNVILVVIDKRMSIENRETFEELVEHVQVPIVIAPSFKQIHHQGWINKTVT